MLQHVAPNDIDQMQTTMVTMQFSLTSPLWVEVGQTHNATKGMATERETSIVFFLGLGLPLTILPNGHPIKKHQNST